MPAARFAGLLLFALVTHTHPLHQSVQCDLSLFTRYGQDWSDGARPYLDRYEPKTPVVFWAFRGVGWRNPPLTLYLVTAVLVALAASQLRPAAGVFLIGFSGSLPYVHMYGAFLAPLMVLAVAWAGSRPVAAGGAFALAVGIFPPAGLCGLALLPFASWRRVGMWLLGAGAVAGLVAVHAVGGGYWAGFLDAMEANRRYGALNRVPVGEHFRRWWEEVQSLAATSPLMSGSVFLGLSALVLQRRSLPTDCRHWLIAGGIWLVAAQGATFAGGRHFRHYYFPLLAPLAVLTAVGVDTLPSRPRRLVLTGFVSATLAVNWWTHVPELLAARRLDPAHERTAVVVAAAYLNQTVGRDEPVLIATWNRWAELYWRVRRPSPSRQVVPFNLAETRPELFAEWAADVLAHPPAWVVTDDTTFGPGVSDEVLRQRSTGFGGPALVGTPSFDQLRDLVRREYTVQITAADLTILRRTRP